MTLLATLKTILALVEINDYYNFSDLKGNLISKSDFYDVGDFSENLVAVQYNEDGKMGLHK